MLILSSGTACERRVSGKKKGAEKAENRMERSGAERRAGVAENDGSRGRGARTERGAG